MSYLAAASAPKSKPSSLGFRIYNVFILNFNIFYIVIKSFGLML